MHQSMKQIQDRRGCRGFTLVELLVVIAIIGVLVGLLLPAVQAAREAARRVSCMNNQTQLGLGAHHFEFSMEHLPSGTVNPEGPITNQPVGQAVSWLVSILPYIEQQAAYQQFDFEAGAYAEANQKVRALAIPTLFCPSNPGEQVRIENDLSVGLNHYVGCYNDAEAPIDSDNNGLLYLNSEVRYSEILDGRSNTILLSECKQNMTSLGWVSGDRSSLRNTSGFDKRDPWTLNNPDDADENPNDVGKFGSYHVGGALFTFADGSTRFISESIDPDLLRQYGNRADGELMSQP